MLDNPTSDRRSGRGDPQEATPREYAEAPVVKTPTEARQAETPGIVRYVLSASLALCGVLGIGLIFYVIYFLR